MEKCRPYLYVKQSFRNFMQVNDNPQFNVPEYVPRPTAIMSFPDAVRNVLINKFGDFNGRATRSEYWWWVLASFIISIPISILDGIIFGWEYDDTGWFGILFIIVFLIPNLTLTVRRLHDKGKSGWFLLILCVPLINICFMIVLLVWFIQDGDAHVNYYGNVPTNVLPVDE
jgi:uncharacterized membrane protein YhaH (DUF805 family)